MCLLLWCVFMFFFFQAEDGIRDYKVTGVQTCALPILVSALPPGLSEVYCHPAEGVAPAMAPYQQGYDHAGELAALTSARVREAVRAGGVQLVSHAQLERSS